VNGKTGPILVQPGNMVSSNNTTTPLVTLNEIQPIKISFALPQSDLPRIQAMAQKKGLVATIALHGVQETTLQAPVDFISNAVNNTSGTIELRATFPNADSALVPGQLVDVTVALAQIPDALVVPREAVNNGPEGQYVYVVNDGAAEQRAVKVLFDDTVNMAVEGDVKAGDQVITDGQLRVIPGGKVQVARARRAGGEAGGEAPRRQGQRRNAN
jgi:multidrug efflux system membrane fusion protein